MGEVAVKTDPMADFQAKLQERVRDDIRDLLPEDAVSALVQKAVETEFFKPRVVKADSWGRAEEKPSWFVEEVIKAARPIIQDAVEQCVKDNPGTVEKVIKDFLDDNRLAVATTKALTEMLSGCILNLQQAMHQNRH